MPKGGRGQFFAFGLGAGTALAVAYGVGLLIALTFNLATYSEHNCGDGQNASRCAYDYARYAQEAAIWSFRIQSQRQKDEADKSDEAAKDQSGDYHDSLDLPAQWLAARSADRMVFWTIFQAIVGAIGIGFILYSLKLNREAVGAAVRAAEAAEIQADRLTKIERPYLTISDLKFECSVTPEMLETGFKSDNSYALFLIHAKVHNQGTRAAIFLEMKSRTRIGQDGWIPNKPPEMEDRDDLEDGFTHLNGSRFLPADYKSNMSTVEGLYAFSPELRKIYEPHELNYFFGYIRYKDMHGVIRRTGYAFRFEMSNVDGQIGFWEISNETYWYDIEEKPESQSQS